MVGPGHGTRIHNWILGVLEHSDLQEVLESCLLYFVDVLQDMLWQKLLRSS